MNEEKNQQLTEAELDGVTGGLVGVLVKAVLGTLTNLLSLVPPVVEGLSTGFALHDTGDD